MVLELLINPLKAERRPWNLFLNGILYSSAGILISRYVFPDYVGIVMVFMTAMVAVYFVQGIFSLEEKKDVESESQISMLKHHVGALSVFMFLFLGFVFSFALWYVFLPVDSAHSVFGVQEKTINCINSVSVQGCATGSYGFKEIFYNNLKVLLLTLVFSLFYGAGAVFILVWNAAIVGTAVGIFVRNSLGVAAETLGLAALASYFGFFSAGILRYMVHGAFEILAYFMAALAGGMLSIAIAKHNFSSPEFRKVLSDAFNIMGVAFGVLLMAAAVEVFVTPKLF